jgi:hypothetical protein
MYLLILFNTYFLVKAVISPQLGLELSFKNAHVILKHNSAC